MTNEIISYFEMCRREGISLQRGMNFGVGGNHSVILMSRLPNAPYDDEIQEDGTVIIYEGHDHPRSLVFLIQNKSINRNTLITH